MTQTSDVEEENLKDQDIKPELNEEVPDLCRKLPSNPSEAFNAILISVGGFGLWQWRLTFLAGCGIFTALHNNGAIFLAAFPHHWCQIPALNLTADVSWKFANQTIPSMKNKDGVLGPSKCKYFNYNYTSSFISDLETELRLEGNFDTDETPGEISCQSWHYDQTLYSSTIVSEWNLVCERRWLQPTIQASYMFGILLGAIIFSSISDSYGRRWSALICVVIFTSSSIFTTFSTSFTMFIALRLLTAASGQGLYLANFVNVTEVSEGKGRTWLPIVNTGFFLVGMLILSMIAYFIRDWRQLQFAISVPTCRLLLYFWILPESPRWLFSKGRFEEGLTILNQIASTNRRSLPDKQTLDAYIAIINEGRPQIEGTSACRAFLNFFKGVFTLVRTPNMRRRSLIAFYGWFVASSVSYGLAFSGHNLNISIYGLLIAMSSVSIILTPINPIILMKFGRRLFLIFAMILGGISCLAILAVPNEYTNVNLALTVIGRHMLGTSFMVLFLFSSKLVPTSVRNLSMGVGSMWGRVGSIISPYIVDLLGEIYYAIPSSIFGLLAILSGLLSFLLPETGYRSLPETVAEVEALPK